MIKQTVLQHPIQSHIIEALVRSESSRFSELRPPRVDTNLFSYHLKLLIRNGFIAKFDKNYTLTKEGFSYIDRVVQHPFELRSQPKIITMLLIQNSDGEVLLQVRKKQPYINTWTLPHGEIRIDDSSMHTAARREAHDTLGLMDFGMRHVGDCYIRVRSDDFTISTTYAHILRGETDMSFDGNTIQWVDPRKLNEYRLAPAIEQIIARSFFGDDHFSAEFEHEWLDATL